MHAAMKKMHTSPWCTRTFIGLAFVLTFTSGFLVSAGKNDDARTVRAQRFIVTSPDGAETAELAAMSRGTVRLKMWNEDRSASVWVGVVDNQPAIAIIDKAGHPYVSVKLEDKHVVGTMFGKAGKPALRAQVGLEGASEPSLNLFDAKGTARVATGIDKHNVATISLLDTGGHVCFQAASAPEKSGGQSVTDLSFYDADGSLIWRAPPK